MARKLRIQAVERYVSGSNAFLDKIHDGERVFLVQGSYGRRPIIANTEDEARAGYAEVYADRIKEDEEAAEFESQN